MIATGLQIIPTMPVQEVIDTIRVAEELGYRYCVVADEGFMPDVYVALGIAARETSTIKLGPVTNGYTRHPAVTASALATLNELAAGRAVATIVAGGSMVLPPMGIAREAPLTVVKETIEIMRQLWTGESISWRGRRFRLDSVQSAMGQQDIPIWLAGSGPKMLALADAQADGVVLTIKSDLVAALELVEHGTVSKKPGPERIFLSNLAYTPEMLAEVVDTMVYVIKDAPPRVLDGFGLSDIEIANIRQAMETGGPPAAARFITVAMLKKYQIAGTPAECRQAFQEMVNEHSLDIFLLDIVSPNFKTNLNLVRNTRSLITQHQKNT